MEIKLTSDCYKLFFYAQRIENVYMKEFSLFPESSQNKILELSCKDNNFHTAIITRELSRKIKVRINAVLKTIQNGEFKIYEEKIMNLMKDSESKMDIIYKKISMLVDNVWSKLILSSPEDVFMKTTLEFFDDICKIEI